MRSRKEAKIDLVQLVKNVLDNKAGRCRPPEIADELLEKSYPKSRIATKTEGIYQFLREGLVKAVTEIVRSPTAEEQLDFGHIDKEFMPYVERLHSGRYFVPELQEQMPVARLIKIPAYLKSAADFMRLKSEEVGREADALEDLYKAVMSRARKREKEKA